MPFTRIYLDSNIFISAALGQDRAIATAMATFIGSGWAERRKWFATSALTLSEVLVRPFRSGDVQTVSQYQDLIAPGGWLDIQEVDRNVLITAAHLRALHQHLKLPDAIHVASASALGCSHLLSDDRGLRQTYQPAEETPPITVIRPEIETLRSIEAWLHK